MNADLPSIHPYISISICTVESRIIQSVRCNSQAIFGSLWPYAYTIFANKSRVHILPVSSVILHLYPSGEIFSSHWSIHWRNTISIYQQKLNTFYNRYTERNYKLFNSFKIQLLHFVPNPYACDYFLTIFKACSVHMET